MSTGPSGIGKADSTIVTAGPESVWQECEAILKTLAGKSSYIGSNVGALAALFLPRQGFMFGMIYGALICAKAGISMDDYVHQIPLTLKVVHDYYDVFSATVPSGNFSNPPASIGTYLAAFQDVLDTFKKSGVPHEFPELLHGLVQRGTDSRSSMCTVSRLSRMTAPGHQLPFPAPQHPVCNAAINGPSAPSDGNDSDCRPTVSRSGASRLCQNATLNLTS
jgi:3-hydroxyisobutyrate dehydrogenase-like beta-hydroxyacid dehydrogenase